MRAVPCASGCVLPSLWLTASMGSRMRRSTHDDRPARSALSIAARTPTRTGTCRLVSRAPPPSRASSRALSPATHVQAIALTAETEAARQTTRAGTVTPLDSGALRPSPFRTTEGLSGWRISLATGRPLATPAVVNGTVYVGGGFGSHEFYAFDARSGQPRWALTVSDDGPTAAVVEDGIVAFNTESCTLFVVDETTGRPLWSRWLGDPLMSQPAIANGQLYMAFPSGGGNRLIAFELRTGRELWRVPIQSDVISAPIAYGDSVFATTFDGNVYRFRASDGGLAWREAYHATSAPWLDGDQVYVSHREEPHAELLSLAARAMFGQANPPSTTPTESVGRMSGSSGESTQAGGGWHGRRAVWLDHNVQQQSQYESDQHASDTAVGFATAPATANAPAASANVGQGTVRGMWEFQGSRPSVVGRRVFLTQGDHLVALDADGGRELWSIPLQGVVTTEGGHLASPPALAGGNPHIAGAGGRRGDRVPGGRGGSFVRSHIGEPMRVSAHYRWRKALRGDHIRIGDQSGSW